MFCYFMYMYDMLKFEIKKIMPLLIVSNTCYMYSILVYNSYCKINLTMIPILMM